jgi:hypothetical protein
MRKAIIGVLVSLVMGAGLLTVSSYVAPATLNVFQSDNSSSISVQAWGFENKNKKNRRPLANRGVRGRGGW